MYAGRANVVSTARDDDIFGNNDTIAIVGAGGNLHSYSYLAAQVAHHIGLL